MLGAVGNLVWMSSDGRSLLPVCVLERAIIDCCTIFLISGISSTKGRRIILMTDAVVWTVVGYYKSSTSD